MVHVRTLSLLIDTGAGFILSALTVRILHSERVDLPSMAAECRTDVVHVKCSLSWLPQSCSSQGFQSRMRYTGRHRRQVSQLSLDEVCRSEDI